MVYLNIMFNNLVVILYFSLVFRKFVVYLNLLIFVALFSLRLDGVVKISYWGIFAPLWIWKLIVLIGAGVGSLAWWKHPSSRMDPESFIHFKSMLVSSSEFLISVSSTVQI